MRGRVRGRVRGRGWGRGRVRGRVRVRVRASRFTSSRALKRSSEVVPELRAALSTRSGGAARVQTCVR